MVDGGLTARRQALLVGLLAGRYTCCMPTRSVIEALEPGDHGAPPRPWPSGSAGLLQLGPLLPQLDVQRRLVSDETVVRRSARGWCARAAAWLAPTSGPTGARMSTSGGSEAVAMALSLSPLPPGFIVPCLPTPSVGCKSGPAWVHEIKHDGYRLIARRVYPRSHARPCYRSQMGGECQESSRAKRQFGTTPS